MILPGRSMGTLGRSYPARGWRVQAARDNRSSRVRMHFGSQYTRLMPLSSAVRAEISAIVGAGQVITEPEQLRVYDCDVLPGWGATPVEIVLPASTEEVQGV